MTTVVQYKKGELTGSQCAAFDLDDTLTSGKAFTLYPGVLDKLKGLTSYGYNIIVISNQVTHHIGTAKLMKKLTTIGDLFDHPIHFFCAREEDEYRKPGIGILSLIPKEYGPVKFFVGDAAGRPGDFSDCDRKMAEASRIQFFTPERFFAFGEIIEYGIPKVLETIKSLTMVIMIGYPSSGKSKYSKDILSEYTHINRDTVGTMAKCKKLVVESFKNNKNVVIDNLNGTLHHRAEFIEIATQMKARVVAIHMSRSMRQCMEWNKTREKKVPDVVYFTFRKYFEPPTLKEGIEEIYTIL